ncbi:hypothetical protein [Bacillus kwashiorkori]|uniref:hypothetical protein n=1 Tax=Bacillus kwashiorkori TaxID=1522318 RepID=UPI000782BA0E|nr:hypothetical protein [Bacillus kwashiorkori]
MKDKILNEKGYSLLLTLMVFLLFTVLAVSLLSITLAGTKSNQASEDSVQATELAVKGIDRITNEINSKLYKELKNESGEITGLPKDVFIEKLEQILNSYKLNNVNMDTSTGSYTVIIEDYVDSVDSNGIRNPLKKKVTFKSTGIADGKQKEVKTVIEIGAGAVPDILNYAVGANKSNACLENKNRCENGEGNVFFHGSSTIQGDIKVDGDLIISDRAYAYLNGEKWIKSLLPTSLPSRGDTNSHIVIGGNIYKYTGYDGYGDHVNFGPNNKYNIFLPNYYQLIRKDNDSVKSAFSSNNAPIVVNRNHEKPSIQVIKEINSIESIFNKKANFKLSEDGRQTFNKGYDYSKDNRKIIPSHTECTDWFWFICTRYSTKTNGDYIFTGDNKFKFFETDGNLSISGNGTKFAIDGDLSTEDIEAAAFIKGNLTIGNTRIDYEKDPNNVDNYHSIDISGLYFIKGNLTIKGAKARFNSMMFVDGDVNIEYSQLSGLGQYGSLIIFATGDIRIVNNSVNQNDPSYIKGFFYSDKNFEMFGVGSNIKIEGGVSARRIVLNAIRGRAAEQYFCKNSRSDSPQCGNKYGTSVFEHESVQKNLPPEKSRLQIIHDQYIEETYKELKIKQPIVTNIDLPKIIERE